MMLHITREVYAQICETLGRNPPECGGVLGSRGDGVISAFYFDWTGRSSSTGYAPDVTAINDMLIEQWMPQGILMVGIVHSHANGNIVPSCGDISYGIRILQALDTVDRFYLPIVTMDKEQIRMDWYTICQEEKHGFVCRKTEYGIV